jgi:hypothetical protein
LIARRSNGADDLFLERYGLPDVLAMLTEHAVFM